MKAAVLSLLAALAAYPFAIYPILFSRRAILICELDPGPRRDG